MAKITANARYYDTRTQMKVKALKEMKLGRLVKPYKKIAGNFVLTTYIATITDLIRIP